MKLWYEDESIKLFQGDCLEVMDNLIEKGIKFDAIITDPPYGTVQNIGNNNNINHGMKNKTEWDNKIDTEKIKNLSEKLLREKGALLLFSQEPYTNDLISSEHLNLPFSYKYIWVKDHFANSLIAKKAPVNYFEEICVFYRKYDIYNENPLRKYFKDIMEYTNLNLKEINNKLGHRKAEHAFYIDSTQFKMCTEDTYNELIDTFKINSMKNFLDYSELKQINSKYESTFNLPKDKKFKPNVLQYKKDYDGFHPTQKPILLMEDLIYTHTNENDLILDFTCGSGTTLLAARNLKRKAIGIELDTTYCDIAKKRIQDMVCKFT